jgi:hypothetical protein
MRKCAIKTIVFDGTLFFIHLRNTKNKKHECEYNSPSFLYS